MDEPPLPEVSSEPVPDVSGPCFEPTHLPEGWDESLHQGSGGGRNTMLTDVWHWSGPRADQYLEVSLARPSDGRISRSFRTLGGEAKLRAFRSSLGKYYEVQFAGCETYWSIGAFGISEEELVTVVEGLRIIGDGAAEAGS